MKKKLIVANWKAYLASQKEVKEYVSVFSRNFGKSGAKNAADVVFCPPFLYLAAFRSAHIGGVAVGAQDVFWEERGPYTGEATTSMLKDAGASYVIIGHSERRRYLGENDEMVSKKLRGALEAKINVILCIGEWTKASDDVGEKKTLDFIKNQLHCALAGVSRTLLKRMVVVYEPVWAISGNSGIADTPENASRMIMFIRRIIAKLYDGHTARSLAVLYGGSVSSQNAAGFIRQDTIDGVLVGSASANPNEFLKIIAEATRKT
ncbi:MAG: triose-phosphate isomerase [bacterium]|nr:triose-phosphate isomerase [bacterium]